jgi:hypothetical protein
MGASFGLYELSPNRPGGGGGAVVGHPPEKSPAVRPQMPPVRYAARSTTSLIVSMTSFAWSYISLHLLRKSTTFTVVAAPFE